MNKFFVIGCGIAVTGVLAYALLKPSGPTVELHGWARASVKPPVVGAGPVDLGTLQDVNALINSSVMYQTELPPADVWQTPEETARLKTGDCEDFAIAKYYALAKDGVDPKDMYVVVGLYEGKGKDKSKQAHAVLQVALGGDRYALDLRHDGREDEVTQAKDYYRHMRVLYGVNVGGQVQHPEKQ